MSDTLSNLLHTLARLARDCVKIIVVFVLAVLVGMMWLMRAALPWLLRAGAVTWFVWGWLNAVTRVGELYTGLTDSVGGLILASAVAFALLALPVGAQLRGFNVWAGFVLAGIVGMVCALLATYAKADFGLQFLARWLPVALAASGLMFVAISQKRRSRVVGHAAPSDPCSE